MGVQNKNDVVICQPTVSLLSKAIFFSKIVNIESVNVRCNRNLFFTLVKSKFQLQTYGSQVLLSTIAIYLIKRKQKPMKT